MGLSKDTGKGKGPSSSLPLSNEKGSLIRVGLSSNLGLPLVFEDGPTKGMCLFTKDQSPSPLQMVGVGPSKGSVSQVAAKRSPSGVIVGVPQALILCCLRCLRRLGLRRITIQGKERKAPLARVLILERRLRAWRLKDRGRTRSKVWTLVTFFFFFLFPFFRPSPFIGGALWYGGFD